MSWTGGCRIHGAKSFAGKDRTGSRLPTACPSSSTPATHHLVAIADPTVGKMKKVEMVMTEARAAEI